MKKTSQDVGINILLAGLAVLGACGLVPPARAVVPSLAAEFAQPHAPFEPPRVHGHLEAKDLGIVINTADPYSVQVGAYYAKARGIAADRILRVSLRMEPNLPLGEFNKLKKEIDGFFGTKVQALALVWRQPYGVNCNSITGALAMGYTAELCAKACDKFPVAPRRSSYFGSISTKPHGDHGMRISMLLAAKDAASAKALIDRGVRSDGTLGLRGAPPVHAHFVTTSDALRSVRTPLFPPEGLNQAFGVEVHHDRTDALQGASRVVLYQTGRTRVDAIQTNDFVPGALADHLTSYGGILDKPTDQMNVLSWIDAGVTATYGTTSEPCAFVEKFPNPLVLLHFYQQGATAIEAYWKSVAWPQQGLFVGEPLAAPFAH